MYVNFFDARRILSAAGEKEGRRPGKTSAPYGKAGAVRPRLTENKTARLTEPGSERAKYAKEFPYISMICARKKHRPPKGDQRGTSSTWWNKIPAHGERARCKFVLHNAILLARAAGTKRRMASHFLVCSLPSHGKLPTMADFRPGGSRRFGASLRSQCRSRGVWVPLSFYASACP